MTQDVSPAEAIWVTQEAYDRLQEELDHLRGEVRSSITAKIAQAREEGDLSENGGYHAAREEQGKNEARIRQLEDRLRRAQIGEKPADTLRESLKSDNIHERLAAASLLKMSSRGEAATSTMLREALKDGTASTRLLAAQASRSIFAAV